MIKTRFIKFICLLLTAVTSITLFNDGIAVSALDGAAGAGQITEEEEIDPKYIQFVTRLYAVVTRQDHADEEEKMELARSLKGGLQAAYVVMYHFYFSDEYYALRNDK